MRELRQNVEREPPRRALRRRLRLPRVRKADDEKGRDEGVRDYQLRRNNPYYLEHTVYRRALALLRDYPRLVAARDAIILSSPEGHGGRNTARPTEQKALRIEAMDDYIRALDKAVDKIPQVFRQGVMDNVIYGRRMDDLPGARSTWSRWRARLLFYVANGKRWI